MPLLFEYGEWKTVSNAQILKRFLLDVWHKKHFNDDEIEQNEDEKDKNYQPFLKFDGNQIRANNFVGFIQNNDELIEIYPKVFRNDSDNIERKDLMLRHIFYWLDYCRKWRFPFTNTNLETVETESFPELIINLIAKQFLETVSNQPLNLYQPLEESLFSPKGSINFSRYITKSLTLGKFHSIECDYEPFLFDNKVNRIIKYCSRLLMNRTKLHENMRILQEVVFILDEVEDTICQPHDAEMILLNPFFEDYSKVLDSCQLILNQQLYSTNSYDFSQWCFLLPMEYIFEDFLAGFLKEKFSQKWKIEYQKSNLTLSDNPKTFQMQHDIFLTSKTNSEQKIIIDTKYKIRAANYKTDIKKGISQNDLYQMVSYAFKRGINEVILVYPNITENINPPYKFEISSGFDSNKKIYVTAIEIPFWSINDFENLDDKLLNFLETIF